MYGLIWLRRVVKISCYPLSMSFAIYILKEWVNWTKRTVSLEMIPVSPFPPGGSISKITPVCSIKATYLDNMAYI